MTTSDTQSAPLAPLAPATLAGYEQFAPWLLVEKLSLIHI